MKWIREIDIMRLHTLSENMSRLSYSYTDQYRSRRSLEILILLESNTDLLLLYPLITAG